jgi:hypothetical protein
MKHLLYLTTALIITAVVSQSCKKTEADPVTPATTGVDNTTASFVLLQRRILTPTCATSGCHASDKDASFSQHGLVLAEGVAYQNLFNVKPKNAAALDDALLRIKPFASLQSLLYHKLSTDASHHSGKSYGNPMPLGSSPLSVGQIEFVRRWIEAGAPKDGVVADAALLDDKTSSVTVAYGPMAPPAAGYGIQMTIPTFDIAPNFEREIFLRKAVGNGQDMYINRFEVSMRPSSHHFLAYSFRNTNLIPPSDVVRDLRNADNTLNPLTALYMSNHVYLLGSPTPYTNYAFPEGMALKIPAGMTLDLNAHYVNRTTATIKGEVQLNLYTTTVTPTTKLVQTIDFGNNSISLPAGQRTTLTKSFTFDKPVKILTLVSHNHKLGEKFVIKIKGGTRDGEIVYTSTDWEHPETITYKTPIALKKGEGLTSEITYNNTTSKTVSFGLTSEDEMGIIFGYYYED